MLITISNLFPRPDQPTRGMYNAQLFGEIAAKREAQSAKNGYLNICLVPEWRVWRWGEIRKWKSPGVGPFRTRYLPVPYLPLVGRRFNDIAYAVVLRNWAKTVKAGDVVYVPWLYPDGVVVERVLRERGARVWLMALGSDTIRLQESRCRQKIVEACTRAEGIVCVAKVLSDRLAASGIPHEKLHVVPNGVDASLFRHRNKVETLDLRPSFAEYAMEGKPKTTDLSEAPSVFRSNVPPSLFELWRAGCSLMSEVSSFKVLFVGNLVPIKGPDVLLRAFAALGETIDRRPQTSDHRKGSQNPESGIQKRETKISKSNVYGMPAVALAKEGLRSDVCSLMSEVSLFIIGSGPMRAKLERQAEELGIAEQVHFLGNRPHGEVALWMNVADVLCLTSRSEGMPNVVVEALASGLPVVATAVGACPELLAGEPASRVCRSEDAEGLAKALSEVLEMCVDRKTMAERNAGKYSWRKMAETILGLMEGGQGSMRDET